MSEPGPIYLEFVPMAARTTQQQSQILNLGGRLGLNIYMYVTAASGTGGLTLQLLVSDPITGQDTVVWAATAVIATGLTRHQIYPGAQAGTGSQWTSVSGTRVPLSYKLRVAVGDASSYTYQVSYELLP